MGKIYSTKTHLSGFDRDYKQTQMRRYWKILSSIELDSMLDNENILIQAKKLRELLESEVQQLMKQGYSIPSEE